MFGAGVYDSRNINKHKNDVLKISQLLSPSNKVIVPASIKDDMRVFVAAMPMENINLKQLGLSGMTMEKILNSFNSIYALT